MINIKAETSLHAWEQINELFLTQNNELLGDRPVGSLTNSWYLYDTLVEIEDPVMEPDFDYAKYFHFTMHKWSKLIGNYLNLDALDSLREYIKDQKRDLVRNRHYNVSFNFTNSHDNGKACITGGYINHLLISDKPELTIFMRAAEVTTRFAVDLCFIQRFGEYIFKDSNFRVKIFIKQAAGFEHLLLLYGNHKKLSKLCKNLENDSVSKKVLDRLKDIKSASEEKYNSYATFMRAYKIIRTDLYNTPKPLLAKNMVIGDWDGIPLPAECPTVLQRNQIKKIYRKMIDKYKMDFNKVTMDRREVKGNSIDLSGSIIPDTNEPEPNEEV